MDLLLTGYPGFLAGAIKDYFENHKWSVDTLGLLDVPSNEKYRTGRHIKCDLANQIPDLPEKKYDLVIHAAGKAHVVPRTEEEKQSFFDVNVTGTEHLLSGLQNNPPKSIVFISSVAVYGIEKGEKIKEDAPLLAKSPYGRSKILAEQLIRETSFSKPVTRGIVRLPLIAGKNAPGNLGSMINAIQKGFYFNVAGGKAARSVVLKEDIAPFLKALGEHGGTYNFTDQKGITYASLYQEIRKHASCPRRPDLPYWFAWCLALAGECLQYAIRHPVPLDFHRLEKLTNSLTFDSSLAEKDIPFVPRPVLDNIKEII